MRCARRYPPRSGAHPSSIGGAVEEAGELHCDIEIDERQLNVVEFVALAKALKLDPRKNVRPLSEW